MSCEVLREAIDAIAIGVGPMNGLVSRYSGNSDRMMPLDRGVPEQVGDAAHMLGRERDLMREVARVAQRVAARG